MVRFAGQMLRRKGYSRNLAFDERVNGEHKDSFRVSLLLRPIEALENYTIYENTDIDENGNAQIFSDFTSTHPLAGQMAMLLNQQQARGVRKLATSPPLSFRFKSRSEERRVGNECVSPFRSRVSPLP